MYTLTPLQYATIGQAWDCTTLTHIGAVLVIVDVAKPFISRLSLSIHWLIAINLLASFSTKINIF